MTNQNTQQTTQQNSHFNTNTGGYSIKMNNVEISDPVKKKNQTDFEIKEMEVNNNNDEMIGNTQKIGLKRPGRRSRGTKVDNSNSNSGNNSAIGK